MGPPMNSKPVAAHIKPDKRLSAQFAWEPVFPLVCGEEKIQLSVSWVA